MSEEKKEQPGKKKISLQDAIKEQLANKKKKQTDNQLNTNPLQQNKTMKSQQAKQTSSTRRKLGG